MGLESVYGKQEVGSDGLTTKQRQFQQNSAMCDKMVDEMIMKQLDSVRFNDSSEDEAAQAPAPMPPTSRAKVPSTNFRPTRSISTLRSREAASALAAPQPTAAPPRVAAAPKSRGVSSLLMPKKKTRTPTNPSSMRNTAAAVTSNNTVGYSKGRSVSSTLREDTVQKPSDKQSTLSPETYLQLYGQPPLESDMWSRCKAAGLLDDSDEAGSSQELEEELPTFEEDEEAQDFQLTL